MEKPDIVNRVALSGLVTLDLEEYYDGRERIFYDLKDNLFQGLILREKDFREFLKSHDWSIYTDKNIAIGCTEDAIIPTWAYMLLSSKMTPFANKVVFGTLETLESELYNDAINKIDLTQFNDKKVVVKGCSKYPVPISAYIHITTLLQPIVQSIMFGEPCSTVPVYKRPRHS